MVGPEQKTILAGKYRLVRQLGKGGMGSVWFAEHLTLQAPVAIKLIDREIAMNPETLLRFLQEAKAAAALRSPHVVQVFDHGVDDGVPFIVMELLEGESLADRLEARGKLSPAETARVLTQVARALTRAHDAGIIHRDLKPENIFLVRNDEEPVAKILDFGIAKSTPSGLALSQPVGTGSGIVMGTPVYMSPEQAEGSRSLDQRADIWAMGVIAFECLVGQRPFEGDTIGSVFLAICARPLPVPSQVGPVPPGFDEWFARVCARDPEARASSAKAAASELRRICGGGVDLAAPSISSEDPVSVALRVDASEPPAMPILNERVSAQSVVGVSSNRIRNEAHERRRTKRRRVSVLVIGSLAALGVGFFSWARQAPSLGSAGAPPAAETAGTREVGGGLGVSPAPSAAVTAAATTFEPALVASARPLGSSGPAASASARPVPSAPASSTRKGPARTSRPTTVKPPAPAVSATRPKVNFGF